MPGKKENPLQKRLKGIKAGSIADGRALKSSDFDVPVQRLPDRVAIVLQLINAQRAKNPGEMICFIMYDISHNKVRTEIAKYLIRKGCQRIQKSVFLARLKGTTYQQIHADLKEVQAMYDNKDSIIFVPVSESEVRKMKIVGQQVDLDIVLGNNNTLFF